jgi:hypothetical protein
VDREGMSGWLQLLSSLVVSSCAEFVEVRNNGSWKHHTWRVTDRQTDRQQIFGIGIGIVTRSGVPSGAQPRRRGLKIWIAVHTVTYGICTRSTVAHRISNPFLFLMAFKRTGIVAVHPSRTAGRRAMRIRARQWRAVSETMKEGGCTDVGIVFQK